LYHIEDEVPECSLEGTAEDIRMAKHSHWRWRVATQRCAPNPVPELNKGLYSWWTWLSSYSACSTHVTCV